jgi:predicted DsbA family dithiol-disulfide isomerase
MLAIEVFSDVICPWCFVGKRRLEQALALLRRRHPGDLGARVVWKPFELNPAMPKHGMDRAAYRRTKFGNLKNSQVLDSRLLAVGESVGISFAFDRIRRTPNTFDAHRLLWLAETLGRQDQLAEALFQAYFVEGEDVGDHAVLARLAERCGVGRQAAVSLLDGRQGEAEVRREEDRAYRAGIHAVPHFLIDDGAEVSGAQKPEVLAAAIEDVLRRHERDAGNTATPARPAGPGHPGMAANGEI